MTSLLSLSVRTSYHQHCWKYKKEKENFLNEICFKYTVFIRERKRIEPIRTRTDILKNESNRTEPEPDDLGSVRVYGSSEF